MITRDKDKDSDKRLLATKAAGKFDKILKGLRFKWEKMIGRILRTALNNPCKKCHEFFQSALAN